MYSKRQLHLLNRKTKVAYLDATGTVVAPPKDVKCKRIYMYALTVNINGIILPVIIMVSAVHRSNAIACIAERVEELAREEKRKWPMFKVLVVDWSWASINAFLKAWNYMSPLDYLRKAYDCLVNNVPFPDNKVIIHCCVGHYQHRVSQNLTKKFPEYKEENNHFILECMGILLR